MKDNKQTPVWTKTPWLVLGSILLIILSSLIQTGGSALLGALQTVILGLGILGCCTAAWRFAKGSGGKRTRDR
ncbi:hypothetical protein [Paenibacillus tengchongensis]|uniref:hypothetical protein n=1 Tax=Paenibacillus tengchongensis TaxID=2608684 RepID=UPI00124EC858|nr:hypothetical protein [Paenibacillus tengchongensis]